IYYSRNDPIKLLEPIVLTIEIKPIELFSMVGTPPQKRNTEIKESTWTKATYILGAEFDLEKEATLKAGKSEHANWEDYTEIVMTIIKIGAWKLGAEMPFDILDIYLESVAIAGCALNGDWIGIYEGLIDIASTALPAPWEFIFAGPEGYTLGKHYSAKPRLLRKVKQILGHGGFYSLKNFRASKDHPLLVNLKEERLAFVDPIGIVHGVKQPRGMRIAYPYFSLVEGKGWGRVFIQSVMDRNGKFKDWKTGAIRAPNLFGAYAVIPPPVPFRPLRIMLRGAPPGKRESYEYGGYELTFETHNIWTGQKGKVILSNNGDIVGTLDLGWEDNPPELVFKKPYACLVSGKLHVKGVPTKIGVGFYKPEPVEHAEGLQYPSEDTSAPQADKKVGRKFIPEVWIEPKGTEYTIEVNPDTKQFTVSVVDGYVELQDNNGIFIEGVEPGQSKTMSLDGIKKLLDPIFDESKRQDELQEMQSLQAGQEVIFIDDFNSENSGQGKLNYRGFENWEVASGGVDLIGNGFWDFHPDHGLHLDLDGSVNKAGTLQSKTKFKLLPGIYTLEFDLAGNFQRTTNSVRVSMGDLYNEEFTLRATDPFRRIKKEIKVSSPMEARLVFQHEGGDNFGLLLDNVRLTKTGGDESIISSSTQSSYQDEGLTTYFGAVFDRHEGEGIKLLGVLDDTPAQNTGLQKGDIILEVENISFRDKGPQPEQFGGMIQDLPVDKPLRFHIERNGKGFDVWIKPLRINKEQLAAFQDEVRAKFSNNYSRGVRLIAQDDYEGAIKFFKKSLKSRPMESHQGLGICYYHLGKYNEARKSIEKAIKLDKKQPLSWFYGAAAMDALNKRNGAMQGYEEYLKFNHDNAEMNAFARERLDALKKKKKSDLSNRLLKAIDAIKKEIEK
ncbi:tetratricopeptide repeat protein, partial [Acidobacteriota bacterium]